ncbi:putative zinc transporter msc2 [Neodidymelliopsis sp. IMI 364377]|nr:putative zinc transporter msc2 [Neodidymelliopsis sp. IMI 364377]
MSGQLYGAVRSPYAEYNSSAHDHSHGHSHSHSHAHSNSNGSTHALTSFANGRTNGRLGGDSPQTPRKNAAAAKYGLFSPVQESAPERPSSSWLDLPEALTALLIPLPYLFASIVYPGASQKLPAIPSEALAESKPATETETIVNDSPLLHALFLTSATLLLVGLTARLRSGLDEPLDRRKAQNSRGIAAALRDVASLKKTLGNVFGVLLPFYAAMQLGGAEVALIFLTAIAAGVGATDQRPGKHTLWDDLKRTIRTRKTTSSVFFGYSVLLTSILAIPPPLPTAGWSLMTGSQTQDSYISKGSTRASLPKASSPLISTSEDTLLTCVFGIALMIITLLVMIERDSRRIAYFGVLNLSFMIVQFFYGFVSGSLGLLTDSIHMLFDCAGLAVGLAAAVMSKWRPNARFPYGYGKIDTLSGFANGVFLLLVSVEIIFDAFERLWEGHELQRLNELLIVSILGFLVNIVGLTAFGHAHHGHGHSHDHGDHDHGHGHSHDNENMQGIFLHILADALGSVAVIISTLLTKYYGWSGWDPIASCIIAILIFLSAIPLVKSSGMRLMLSLPTDAEYGVRNTLQELSSLRDVVGYTVPKFWLEDEGAAHAEAHAKEHEHEGCDSGHHHDHNHGNGNAHKHKHSGHDHDHDHSHAHDHSHPHSHSNGHAHDHHGHDHDHSHASGKQRILGVIHVIASQAADVEDVRERTIQFLKGRNMDVVVHVEKEGDGRCWCGGGNKMS